MSIAVKDDRKPAAPNDLAGVLDLYIDIALDKPDPAKALVDVYNDRKFAYPSARRQLTHVAWLTECRKLDELKESGEFPSQLRACFTATNELVDEALSLDQATEDRARQEQDAPARVSSHMAVHDGIAWAGLMIEQMDYVSSCSQWSEDHLMMLEHSCRLLSSLLAHWSDYGDQTVPPHLASELVRSCQSVLTSEPFQSLFRHYDAQGVVEAVHQVVHLSASLNDIVLAEELIELIPEIRAICAQLDPQEYSRSEDRDELELSEEPEEDDSVVAEDGDLAISSEKGFEITDEAPESGYEDLRAAQLDYLCEHWSELFKKSLLVAHTPGFFDHRKDIFLDLVRGSPFEMQGYQLALDALVCVSDEATRKFIPELVELCKDEQLGTQFLLSLVSFRERTGIEDAADHLPDVVRALLSVTREERTKILSGAKNLVENYPELFDGSDAPDIARRAVKRLHVEVEKLAK